MRGGAHDGSNRHDYFQGVSRTVGERQVCSVDQGVREDAMAKRTEELWREYAENLLLGIALCDRLNGLGSTSSEQFHALSVHLWLILAETEQRIVHLRQRHKRRKRKWRQSSAARRASAEVRQAHLNAWVRRVVVLEERQGIVKQVGDAFAWTLALGDPRFTIPLYKPATHHLPKDHSVDGVLRMLEAGAGTADYLMVPTDLTRCCGIGDFLIRGSNWPYASPFEAKVKREPDGMLLCMLHGWNPVFQLRPEELERFQAAFGFTMPADRVSFDERGERQKVEVNRSTSEAKDSLVSLSNHADPSLKRNWKNLEGVLERAVQGHVACDLVEPGLIYAAAPIRALSNPDNVWEPILKAFKKLGVNVLDGDWDLTNSFAFISDEELSPLVSPIPIWKISSRLKSVLMAGHVVLVIASRKNLWEAAFRAVQVEMVEEDSGVWKMSAAGRDQIFDHYDVIRLKFGLWYAGVSPQHTARIVAMQLYRPGSVHVDRYGTPDSPPKNV
jgi:hypothetical protein